MNTRITSPELQQHEVVRGWGKVEYTRLPAMEPIDDFPIVLKHGFAGFPEAYEGLQVAFVDQGKDAINPLLPRSLKFPDRLLPFNLSHAHRLASQGTRAVVEDLHDNQGVEQVDLVVHSKAARDAMWMLQHLSGLLRSLIIVGGVGGGSNRVQDFIPRFPTFARREGPPILDFARQNASLSMARGFVRHMFTWPQTAICEIGTIHHADLRGRLSAARYSGVAVGFVEMEDDGLLPPEDTDPSILREITAPAGPGEVKAPGATTIIPEGLHVSPITEPDIVAKAVVALLRDMHDPTTASRAA